MTADLPLPVQQAAARLASVWESGTPCAPVRDRIAAGDVDAAYAVQDIGTERMLASGRRLVGRKIGLTSPVVQQQLGVDQPDYGMLFDDMDVAIGAVIPWGRVQQPRIEAEIAFVLKDDLNDARLTSADVLSAIDYALVALEIVGSRIAGWDISLVDTIADNASSGLFAIGHRPRRMHEIDVIGASMTMSRGDEVVSTGSGASCLGSPVSALLWLARMMVARGRPLGRGDLVLSGALGPMVPVNPGDHFTATIDGLGSVTVRFGDAA
jgi:2-keto-4-pentenoate hydratase